MNHVQSTSTKSTSFAELLHLLRRQLPEDCIISDAVRMKPYECDGLSVYKQMPRLVVLPETAAQVVAVLQACQKTQTPIVPRGAGTSLSGGAMPHADGIVLSVAKLNKIIAIDAENRTATVQAGVRNLAISQAVAPLGLYYAPDPSSQIACTIGGNVAENAGGVHCLKYGLTVHNVLQIKMATLSGEVLTFGARTLNHSGYDLLSMATGAEGMLGIIVEVVVRLLPQPAAAKVMMAVFDDTAKAGAAVAAVIAAGIIPAGFELMDNLAICAVEDFVHAGYPTDAEAILLCELDGIEADIKPQLAKLEQIFNAGGAKELRLAKDATERALFWSGRKNAFPAVGRVSPDYYCMDGTIPRQFLAQVLGEISVLSKKYGLAVANVFHAGDGNLHPLILYDANLPSALAKTEAFGGEILDLCIAVGGTITGEHGVGVEKIDRMCLQFSDAELAQFRQLRRVFDPDGLLNPDKAVPTLNRCAEFGAMHVHNGQLPHPEIERF